MSDDVTVFLTKRDRAGKIECMFDLEGSVRLEVLDPLTSQAPEELVQDVLTLVSVFAGRLSGHPPASRGRAEGM